MPGCGRQSRLLDQLPLGGQQISFTVDVEQPGRRLAQAVPNGMAILTYERDPRLIIKRDDAHGTRVAKIFPGHLFPVRGVHLILHEGRDVAVGKYAGRSNGPAQRHVDELRAGEDDHPQRPWSTGSRVASLRSSAASIKPTNSGCGLVGRDFSSGWA